MLKIALAQIRTHARRYIAVSLAVILGVGFLASAFIFRTTTTASLEASLGAQFPASAVVVSTKSETFNLSNVEASLADLPTVSDVQPLYEANAQARLGNTDSFARLINTVENPELSTTVVQHGSLPATAQQLAIDAGTASKFGYQLGDTISITSNSSAANAGQPVQYQISAITAPSQDPRNFLPELRMNREGLSLVAQQNQPQHVLVLPESESSVQEVQADVVHALGTNASAEVSSGAEILVLTASEKTMYELNALTEGTDTLTPILLGFAAMALVVTALVISNTFSVLIAGRTRELALLRCVGAQSTQIRRAVLIEALVVGLLASLLGIAVAVAGLWALTSWVSSNPEYAFATFAADPLLLGIAVAVGVLMTVIAALAPAARATSIAPLAALRPHTELNSSSKSGKVRLVSGSLAAVGGFALLAAGFVLNSLALAFFGALLSFLGVLLIAGLFIPRAVAAVGRLVSGTSVPAKLAALNSVRNPARTTATASAVLIGATLVSTMMVGATTARSTLDTGLSEKFPVDISVVAPAGNLGEAKNSAAQVDKVRGVVELYAVGVVDTPSESVPVMAADSAAAKGVINDPNIDLGKNVLYTPKDAGISDPATVTGVQSSASLAAQETKAWSVPLVIGADVAQQAGLSRIAADAQMGVDAVDAAGAEQLWVKLAPNLSAAEVMDVRSELVEALGVQDFQVGGAAIERAQLNQVIDVLLMIVLGLLAVAVVISVIGVANTLSLSVIERTRESALLRALGLTRAQLRWMLSIEAVLIALVSTALGVLLGAIYGTVGAATTLSSFAEPVLRLPWLQFALILVVAVGAGLAASLMPARQAARLSPIQGLATE